MNFEFIGHWLETNQTALAQVLVIFIVALLVHHFGKNLLAKLVQRTVRSTKHTSGKAEQQREQTLVQIMSSALHILIWPIAVLMALPLFEIEIAPLLAGAGIVGVALGFGAQSFVENLIAGLFIIIEDQYRVGDVISITDTSGVVEHISLRVTVLRDLDGVVHHVPNGSIVVASNMSKGYSGINLDVGIGYENSIEKATDIINQIGQDMAEDEEWRDMIIEPPQFLRVDGLDLNAVTLKITGKTYPLKQWEVTGELRRRIKDEFTKADIDLPYQQQVLRYFKAHEHLPPEGKDAAKEG